MLCEIVEFNTNHEEGLIRCISHLQDTESSLEPDRLRASTALSEAYASHLKSQCRSKNGQIFVAIADSLVVGFVALWQESDADNLITSLKSYAYISDIVVLPAYQRSGFAKSLMAAAEDFAKRLDVTHCKVGVLAKNLVATKLYEGCGFRQHEVSLIKEVCLHSIKD
jgi:ribosomal protein S18 acetylase RimI-like enzyme